MRPLTGLRDMLERVSYLHRSMSFYVAVEKPVMPNAGLPPQLKLRQPLHGTTLYVKSSCMARPVPLDAV